MKTLFDYDRLVVGFHGTRRKTAEQLVAGKTFGASTNADDWLGHGIYFWEYAPQQAWWWAERRYGADAAVVGALVRLGRCFDLLDPENTPVLQAAHSQLLGALDSLDAQVPENANNHKYLDCAVFNYLCKMQADAGTEFDSIRSVFVPFVGGKLPRVWTRSGVFAGAHIQICVRRAANIVAVWPMRRDGRHGLD